MKTRTSLILCALAVLALVAVQSARATTLYWDINGATANVAASGSGTWDGTNAWWNTASSGTGGTPQAATANTDDLIFSSGSNYTGVTVTLDGARVASSISFEDNIVQSLTSGTSLTLGGTGTNSGILVLSGDNSANTISTALILGAASIIQTAGTDVLTISGGVTGAYNLTLNNNSTNAAGITISTASLNNTGTITNSGTSTGGTAISAVIGTNVTGVTQNSATSALTLSGANLYTGLTTVSAGTLTLGHATDTLDGAVTVNGTGAILALGTNSDSVGAVTLTAGDITGSGTLTSTSGFTMNNAGTTSASAILAGSGIALTKTGAGTLTLSGTSTYTGATTVSNGTLQIGNGSTTGALATGSSIAIANNATLAFNRTDTVTQGTNFASVISGTGAVTQAGTGTLVLNGANTYTGLTTVSAGTLKLGAAGSGANTPLGTTAAGTTVAATGAALDLGGFTLATAETLTLNGTGVSSGGALTNSSATAATYSGLITLGSASSIVASSGDIVISNAGTIAGSGFGLTLGGTATGSSIASIIGTGAGTLTKSGDGTWTLSVASTYTGVTTVSAGTLQLGTGVTDQNGSVGSTSIVDNSTLLFNNFNNQFYSGIISGTGALTKTGAGTLILSGENTYSGATTVNAGALRTSASNVLPNAAVTVSGTGADVTATLDLHDNSDTISTLSFGGSTTTSGAAVTTGAGTLTLGGNVTYTATNNPLGATISGKLALGANRTFTIGNSTTADNDLTVSAVISGTDYGVTKAGAGTLLLSGANTYTGATTVSAGTLVAGTNAPSGSAGAFGNATSEVVLGVAGGNDAAGILIDVIANGIINGDYTVARIIRIPTSDTTDSGTRVLTLGGNMADNSIFSGNIFLGTTNYAGRGVTLTAASGGQVTFSGVIQDPSGMDATTYTVTKSGAGTVVLSGNNTYTGGTTISAGTLTLGRSGGTILDAAAVTVSGGTLNVAYAETVAAVTLSSGTISGVAALTGTSYSLTGSGTVSAVLAGSGVTLTKTGSGTATLSGTNTYTGATTISAGTLSVGANANLGNANALVLDGGTLQITGTTLRSYASGLIGTHAVTQNDGDTIGLDINNARNTFTVSQVLAQGAGGLTKTGAGTLVLSGTNTYTGATTVNAGTLRSGASNVLPASAVTVSGNAAGVTATLNLNGNSDTIGALSFGGSTTTSRAAVATGAGTLTLGGNVTYTATNNPLGATISGKLGLGATRTFTIGDSTTAANDLTVSAVISGSTFGLTKAGDGTLLLSGANTYTGATTLTAGTLSVGANANLGNANTLVLNGGTLRITGTTLRSYASGLIGTHAVTQSADTTIGLDINNLRNAFTVSQVLAQGTGGLTKTGAGTLVLSGTNTYSGATTVNAGTLRSGASNVLPAAVTVSGNAAGVTPTLNLNGYSDTIGALTFGGSTATSGAAVATGAGTLTLGDNVTYTATNNPLGATISGKLALGATRTFTIGDSTTAANDLTVSAVISGSTFGLTKAGAGTLRLSGANTYTGVTTLSAGVLRVATIGNGGVAGGLGQATNAAANLVFDDGTLQYTGATAGTDRNFTINAGHTATFDITTAGSNLTVSGASTSTSGILTKIGAGTLTLSGNNLYTGLTTVSAGTLTLGRVGGTILDAAAVTVSGGTLNVANAETVAAVTLSSGTISGVAALTGASYSLTNTGTVSAVLAGSGIALTKTGAGTATLSAANTYTGVTTVSAGTLVAGTNAPSASAGAFGTATSDVVLGVAGGNDDAGILTNGAYTVARIIRIPTSNTTDAGTRVLTLGGNTAVNSIFSGDIFLGTTSQAGRGVTLTAASGGQVTFSGVIQNPSGMDTTTYTVTKSGAGTVVLSGNNTYTGGTTISAGTLTLGRSGGTILDAAAVTVSGGTLNVAYAETVGAVTLSSGTISGVAALTGASYSLTGSGTVSAVLAGTGIALTKTGGGTTTTLSAANTYTGNTTITSGTLKLTGSGRIASSPIIDVDSGAFFDVSTLTGGYTLASGKTIKGSGTVKGAMTVAGTLSPGDSTGTLTVNNATETWAGGGTYAWQLLDATGTAGTDWDLAAVTGTGKLAITATSGNKFIIELQTLSSGPDTQGTPLNWDAALEPQSWMIASSANAITGWDVGNGVASALFTIDADNFEGEVSGASFTISKTGNNVFLNYSYGPEPATLALLGLGGLGLILRRKRR